MVKAVFLYFSLQILYYFLYMWVLCALLVSQWPRSESRAETWLRLAGPKSKIQPTKSAGGSGKGHPEEPEGSEEGRGVGGVNQKRPNCLYTAGWLGWTELREMDLFLGPAELRGLGPVELGIGRTLSVWHAIEDNLLKYKATSNAVCVLVWKNVFFFLGKSSIVYFLEVAAWGWKEGR